MIHYIAGNFEAENLLNVTVTAVVGQHSQVSVHCYPLQFCLLRYFGGKQFHC